jgi:hypothetical protein
MMIRNSALYYLLLSAILIAVFFSCSEENQVVGSGILKGKISIGPICPVQKDPPDPGCLPTSETYKAWATAVWTVNRKTKIATILPAKDDGLYQIELPAGHYIIDFDAAQTNKVGSSNLPADISIANMDTTKLNINIDTGIR